MFDLFVANHCPLWLAAAHGVVPPFGDAADSIHCEWMLMIAWDATWFLMSPFALDAAACSRRSGSAESSHLCRMGERGTGRGEWFMEILAS